MAKAKKVVAKKPRKRAYKKTGKYSIKNASQLESDQPFEIEAKPPGYRVNPELQTTLKRVDATIKVLLPNQAFIVPAKSRHTIKKHLKENYPRLLFMYSRIADNPSMMRVYLLKVL